MVSVRAAKTRYMCRARRHVPAATGTSSTSYGRVVHLYSRHVLDGSSARRRLQLVRFNRGASTSIIGSRGLEHRGVSGSDALRTPRAARLERFGSAGIPVALLSSTPPPSGSPFGRTCAKPALASPNSTTTSPARPAAPGMSRRRKRHHLQVAGLATVEQSRQTCTRAGRLRCCCHFAIVQEELLRRPPCSAAD